MKKGRSKFQSSIRVNTIIYTCHYFYFESSKLHYPFFRKWMKCIFKAKYYFRAIFFVFLAGTNDAFVTIGIGKEKYQTSVKEKATENVEWCEQCEL